MTLDDMYIETAMYVDETITKTDGEYAGNSLIIVNKFKSALNYAYKKICREKFPLEFTETVFSGDNLTKTLVKVKYVKAEDIEIPYSIEAGSINFDYDGQVEILYEYMPDNLANLTDVPELPEEKVDHKILCYWAAFNYFNIDDDDRANKWLSMWNDGFDSINRGYKKFKRVKAAGW